MASAAVDSPSDRLRLDSIATVDLHLLSQSDLYALSLCSHGAFDSRRCDDVVVPKIDRSVFNESAGSRKQTYSRLRLAPRKPQSSAASATTSTVLRPKSDDPDPDPERSENSQIIALLKNLFSKETNGDDLVPVRVEYSESEHQLPDFGHNLQKRKRGRPRKNEDLVACESFEDRDREIGSAVDLVALAILEDPFGDELQRRTGELKTEEELLGFLTRLNGQWGSRRRKKKIVDASEFGNALPKGWKILLSLKKKEGRVWLFVRRYISPYGRQFVSCKEVSSYLLSLGLQDVNRRNCGQSSENTQLTYKVACGNSADLAVKEINERGDLVCYSPSVITYVSNDHVKQVTSVVENSGEIQSGEILKCDKCTMTFDVKDDLLHHLLSSHRRKRSRFGSSITDGVIIKDGQYECQFCHKTFNERNRYNGSLPPKESTMQTPSGDDCDSVNFHYNAANDLKPVSPQSTFEAGSVADMSTSRVDDCPVVQGRSMGSRPPSLLAYEKTCGAEIDVNGDSISGEEPNQEAGSGKCFACSDRAGPDEDLVSEGKQQNGFGGCSLVPVNNDKKCGNSNNVNVVSTSAPAESKQKRGSESIDEKCVKDNVHSVSISTVSKLKLNAIYNSGNKEVMIDCGSGHSGRDEDAVARVEQKNSENSLINSPRKEPLRDIEENMRAGTAYTMEEFGHDEGSESSLFIRSGYEQTCGVNIDIGNTSTRKMEEPKLDEFQTYRNNELAFDISNSRPNVQERSLVFCSLVLSGNEQKRNVEEIAAGVMNSTEQAPKQESSLDTGLLTRSCTGKTIDVVNRVPIERTFSFETYLSRGNNSLEKYLKQESGLLGPSCYPSTCGDENNLNRVHAGRFWEGSTIDEVGSSGHDKLTIAFGSSNAQPDGYVMPGSIWGACGGNVLQSNLADISTQQEQSSSCYPFSIFSDKGEHELLNVDRKYDSMSGFEGTQSDRSEHVEFSFLTPQSLNPLPGDSKALSYETEMRGFDSSFWLEKDALSLNIAARNHVTTVCAWCRNEFHQDSVHSGTQTGAVVSICPTCSANVSAQFNFF
ncbi:methyl-CPG-binding domain 8 [Actinidia rufa]|uniref:Methyl-CPG-binding domain 8 n=1 Tax=Actinidia rufa TaxID=165716 RepID=A0A7J0FBY3_9ERIC|nr:methyl-CPG-binding domain 8 [Actinidia rufa]